ncbi:MAG: 4Fe-4S binding protein [Promethearchaeota archaeon]
MVSEDVIYHQLRKEIDKRMPVGAPQTQSGVEIKLLKEFFSPKEAEIAVHLSALPEKIDKIHKRLKKNNITIHIAELEDILDSMVKKGIIMGGMLLSDDPKKKLYSLAQFAVGMFEFSVDKLNKEKAKLSEEYMKTAFYKEFLKKNVPTQMRTIPIEKSLETKNYVATYDNIIEIINKKEGPFSVVNCVCRQTHDLIGDKCKLSDIRRCCVMFNDKNKFSYDVENPEEISKEELLAYMDEWQKAGFVLQPENAQDPMYMCVCCGCCCGVLQCAKQFPKPAEYYSSNYYAVSDPELCNGCGVCIKRCQMDAIDVINKKAVVNHDRCIGCGNCVPSCGMKAMTIKLKEKITIPPKNHTALYTKIMMKKKGLIGALALVGKVILGKKV